ncbi:MAG: sigma-70 family RNA polymerase sigma factor [Tissierellaceae bacterium]|nr:sigma-70 family RNA polymerase sigma factor [Tissierellaceae bacterium]
MNEKKLIRDLKKGKEEAYYELINLYGNKLLKSTYLVIKDEKHAEDIVQETFIRVFKYIKNFKGDSSIYTWIYRISHNVTMDFLKSSMPTIPYEDYLQSNDDIEDITILNMETESIKMAMDNLKIIYKQVLVLFYFDDLSIKEMSEVLGEKEGTIKSRLSRGRVELKKILVKEEA